MPRATVVTVACSLGGTLSKSLQSGDRGEASDAALRALATDNGRVQTRCGSNPQTLQSPWTHHGPSRASARSDAPDERHDRIVLGCRRMADCQCPPVTRAVLCVALAPPPRIDC